MPFHIAIDGPVSAGKGTVSRLIAQRLGFLYVDTGAMYRMTAYLALKNKVNPNDEDAVANLIQDIDMQMRNPNADEQDGRLTTVFLDGEDVSWKIRTEEVSQGSSKVAVHPKVRQILVKKQQEIAKNQDVIMEGRDITHKVLPHADLKIFLTANEVVRAKRRCLQLQIKGQDVTFDEIYKDLMERDERDSNRKTDPLKIVDDAWVVDTSDLEIDKVVNLIVKRAHLMLEQKNEKKI
jgi:cytidylate kinase